ncbi:MAG TPA: formimidoylglutamate deiminase [Pyrinomonadaceae bacterium]
MNKQTETVWLPDLLYHNGQLQSDKALVADASGNVLAVVPGNQTHNPNRLKNRALLPGLVNAHSHAFQRVIRGRTEYRSSQETDSFWTWRELMYRAANRLSPDDVYTASRMAFLEMAVSGITAVGEFHYLHNKGDGTPYDDPNLLAREVIRAANDVGIRIALLRVAYARSGYQIDANPLQVRFIEPVDDYLKALDDLVSSVPKASDTIWAGAAPHSVRAVPLDYLKKLVEFAREHRLQVHMHVAEQPAEVSACIEEYGRSPVALLDTEGLLSERFTAVHAIHVSHKAVPSIARAHATVCACPSTERNLGDGVVPADSYFEQDVPVALGTDSQIQIDLLEDARELEYHLRLQRTERNVLVPPDSNDQSALAKRLFECATVNGARSIGLEGGALQTGTPADFFTVDLNDPSIAGAGPDDLLSSIVFSLSRTGVKDVVVGGRKIVEDGRHPLQDEVVENFGSLQKKLWS